MRAPRFLLSTIVLPWPPDQGSKRFTLELARSLRAVGPVSWVSRATSGHEAAREALEEEGFEIRLDESWADRGLFARSFRRLRGEWEALRRGVPRVLTYACTSAMRRAIRRELDADPQLIVVGAFWFEAPAVRLGGEGRRVLVLSDLEYHRAAEKLGRDPEGPLPMRAERLRRAEKEALMSCDALLCLTEDDLEMARRALEDIPHVLHPRLGLWPAVVPVLDPPPPLRERRAGDPQRWLLYGHWNTDFNRDGLERFLTQIWSALRRAVPTPPELRVAGGGLDTGLRRRLESEGAVVLGWVEDLRAELALCDAVVVPLYYAGGLRYRMLEAMAAHRPVICTPVAARGAGAGADTEYLQAETANEWSRAWRQLEDPELARRIAAAGHAFVRERYGPQSRAERVRAVLAQTLGERFDGGEEKEERS